MKTNIITIAMALLMPVSMGIITSCQREDPTPTLELREFDTEITMYQGNTREIPFTVSTNGVAPVSASILSSQGCEASVSAGTTGGTIRLTLKDSKATATADIQAGEIHRYITVKATAYRLEIKDAPEDKVENFGDGNEYSFTVTLDTNLPDGMVSVTGEDWMTVNTAGDKVTVTLQNNRTFDIRKGVLSITDKESRLDTRTVSVTQDWNYEKEEGYVYFADRNLFRAVVRAADRDGDGRITPDEALDLTELDASGYGIADLSGIGQLENLEVLNLKDNSLEGELNLSDLRMLHSLELQGNRVTSLDITGCCKVFSYLGVDDYEVNIYFANYLYAAELNVHPILTEKQNTQTPIEEKELDEFIYTRKHSKGKGIKIYLEFPFITTQDIADGSYERLAEYYTSSLFALAPTRDFEQYFDVIVTYTDGIVGNHGEYTATFRSQEAICFAMANRAYIYREINDSHSLYHELIGHVIGSLEDEYPQDHDVRIRHINKDDTSNPETISWSKFLKLEEYKTSVGIVEKKNLTGTTYYVPTERSVMGGGGMEFNAPSRYAIFCAIMSQSDEHPDWKPDYSEESFQAFLKYDKINL